MYTKGKENTTEVVDIAGQQFRRHIPPPPLHSKLSFFYSPGDLSSFPCCNYQDRILLTGPLEEDRVLQQRFYPIVCLIYSLTNYRKQAAELKSTVKGIKENRKKVDDLTNEGDIASGFKCHEDLHILSKKAIGVVKAIASDMECNTILLNTLESKMKAAGDIAEYEQAQCIKTAMEVSIRWLDEQ